MKTAELAMALRERLGNRFPEMREIARDLSDEQVIDSYITCPSCGHKELSGTALYATIANAKSAEHFFKQIPPTCQHN